MSSFIPVGRFRALFPVVDVQPGQSVTLQTTLHTAGAEPELRETFLTAIRFERGPVRVGPPRQGDQARVLSADGPEDSDVSALTVERVQIDGDDVPVKGPAAKLESGKSSAELTPPLPARRNSLLSIRVASSSKRPTQVRVVFYFTERG